MQQDDVLLLYCGHFGLQELTGNDLLVVRQNVPDTAGHYLVRKWAAAERLVVSDS